MINLAERTPHRVNKMANTNQNHYYLQIDILKCIAILSVIIVHTIDLRNNLDLPVWISLMIAFSLAQAIPIFFILMGRNAGASFERKRWFEIRKLYSKTYFITRFYRLIVPLIITFIVSFFLGLYLNKIYLGILNLIGYFPLTGYGNYFISIILQYILVFPLLYFFYKKNSKITIIFTILISIVFEVVSTVIPILQGNSYLYQACILRYIFALVLGLWLVDNFDNRLSLLRNKYIILGLLISISYIVMNSVYSFKISFFTPYWQPENFLAFFYPLIFCAIGMRYLPSKKTNLIVKTAAFIGKASYHIFLVQILFTGIELALGGYLIILLLNILNLPLNATTVTITAFNILVNVMIGVLFFVGESKFTKFLRSKFYA
jgi:hypothetical protein